MDKLSDTCSKSTKKKARKYGKLDAPLIVAVNARDMFYNGKIHDMEVLFGKERLLYSKENPDLPPVPDREPNGVWSQDMGIDAVWRFQRVDILNFYHNASACLYINPTGPTWLYQILCFDYLMLEGTME